MTAVRHARPLAGALYVCAAALMFAGMGATIKLAAAQTNNEMIVFFRNLFGIVAMSPWLLHQGWDRLTTRCLHLHLIRGATGLAAMYCFFYSIAHLQLAEAVLFNFSAPLFMPFIAFFWLHETLNRRLSLAAMIGFVGIVLVLRPTSASFTPVALVGVMAGIFAAFAMVTVRRLTATEPALRVVFYFALFGTLISALPMLLNWQTPNPQTLLLLAGVGLFATLGQYFLTRGYASAPAAQAAPFTYMAVIFAALIGWWIWDETLGIPSFVGATLVISAGILAIVNPSSPPPDQSQAPPKSQDSVVNGGINDVQSAATEKRAKPTSESAP